MSMLIALIAAGAGQAGGLFVPFELEFLPLSIFIKEPT